jgi:hypothetical protein
VEAAEKDGVERRDVGGIREISDPRASWLLCPGSVRRNEHGSEASDEGAAVHPVCFKVGAMLGRTSDVSKAWDGQSRNGGRTMSEA